MVPGQNVEYFGIQSPARNQLPLGPAELLSSTGPAGPWGSVPGQMAMPPVFSSVSVVEVGDDLHCLLIGPTGFWHTFRRANQSWRAFKPLPPGPAAGLQSAVISRSGPTLVAVAIDGNGALSFLSCPPNGDWSRQWLPLPQSAEGLTTFGQVACAGFDDGLELYAVRREGALCHSACDAALRWQGPPEPIPATLTGAPLSGIACAALPGTPDSVAITTIRSQDGELRFSLSPRGGVPPQPAQPIGEGVASVACCQGTDANALEVIATDPRGTLIHRSGQRAPNGMTWGPWGVIGPVVGTRVGNFTACAATRGTDATTSWLLPFADATGRPWGDGTAMAGRAGSSPPFDVQCKVTPMLGGFETLKAIRDTFEAAIADAEQQSTGPHPVPPGDRGHVYIADWLFNALRDLSTQSNGEKPSAPPAKDQTALGLVLRMMSAGIAVRLMLWMPTQLQRYQMGELAIEHWNVAAAVQDHDLALKPLLSPTRPLGVVALDLRTASSAAAALHQKQIVVRVGAVDRAFCGGVDLAFTRRDYRTGAGLIGDWQSGDGAPLRTEWLKQTSPLLGGYPGYPYVDTGARFPEDLLPAVYGSGKRHWHDHHLQLEGPIVATLEAQFGDRWISKTGTGDTRVYLFDRTYMKDPEKHPSDWWKLLTDPKLLQGVGMDNQVQLTSADAISGGHVVPLPAPAPVPEAGTATVQMWRTIPLRTDVSAGPNQRGEFTVMAGVARAIANASQLITIWDQYFWSEPLALLLARCLMAKPALKLLIVLPPYGTTSSESELGLRARALTTLWKGLDDAGRARVQVRNPWRAQDQIGVYVHAKVQTYDDQLLVCGSANMNRRSLECDAELDCAVLAPDVVRLHLLVLFNAMAGGAWTDWSTGWLGRYWKAMGDASSFIDDQLFVANPGTPTLPNGVALVNSYPSASYSLYEPTSIHEDVDHGKDGKVQALDLVSRQVETASRTPATGPAEVPSLHP